MSKKFRTIFFISEKNESELSGSNSFLNDSEKIKEFLSKINEKGKDIKLKSQEEEIKTIKRFKPIP